MRNFRSVIPLAGAMAASMMLTACMDESPWGSTSNETGTIDITLTTDYSFDTSKPVFTRAEGDGSTTKDLSDYTTLPALDQFMITLEQKGSADSQPVFKNTYDKFKDFIGESKELAIGQYTITASCGDPSEQGFDKPYLEDSYTFSVLPNHTTEISLKPELKNSMVQVAYTQDFIDYMKSYTAKLTSGASPIEFSGDNAGRAAFVNPNEASIVVEFVTKYTDKSANVQIGKFAPVAKTLHLITFDVAQNDNGFASITVNLNDDLTDEVLSVDITDDLYTASAPVITPSGFVSGVTYDWTTRKDVTGKESFTGASMIVEAKGGIKEANLVVEGTASQTIDLYNTTESDLNARGIIAKGFYKQDGTACMATLDLNQFVQNLTTTPGEYTISLTVVDSNSQTNDPVSVTLNSKPVTATESVENGTSVNAPVAYGANTATVSIDFNGSDPTAVVFKTQDGDATYDENAVVVESLTRAFDTKRCTYTLTLPESSSLCENVRIDAYYNGSTTPMANITLPVDVPAYSISDVDAFAHYAYLKIDADPSVLALVTRNIKLKSGNTNLTISDRDEANGILTVTNLSDNTPYSLKTSITGGEPTQQESKSIVTEEEKSIPNGDFLKPADNCLKIDKITVGGKWYSSWVHSTYHYSSIIYDLPENWETINNVTASKDAKNMCSWYVVASSWLDNGRGFMRNVGYNNNGKDISDSSGTHTDHYCRTSPDDGDLLKAAGVLSLGSYDFTSGVSEGILFDGRPDRITFDYEYHNYAEFDADYSNKKDKNTYTFDDQGYAYVELFDIGGASVVEKIFDLDSGSGTKSIPINYEKFGNIKISKLKVVFKSSKGSVPIHIPKDEELSEGDNNALNTSSKTFDANQYHALARGSELWVDNVTAHYDEVPPVSSAPKRNYTKKGK